MIIRDHINLFPEHPLRGKNLDLYGVRFPDMSKPYSHAMIAELEKIAQENNIKVPKQFSIVGFDDMPIARYLIPKLTTIRYPIDLMANYAAKLALSLVDSSIVTPTVVQFNPTLVRRFSVENAMKP